MPTLPIGAVARCARCRARVAQHRPADATRAAALALAALILLLPANLLPILQIEYLGRVKASTVWSGCVALWDEGMTAVAIVVFLASIVIPFAKLAAIFTLCWLDGSSRFVRTRVWLLRQIERIGRWSMLDVFLLAILVALVKLDSLSSARPGPGLFFFAAVVVLTILASASFDSRSLWQELQTESEQ
ncbi:MAG: paraquat-inducible protein A [Phycisphaerae bacterium]|nr:paraquat-inducible protein A [Phycisphaerae bacterium]